MVEVSFDKYVTGIKKELVKLSAVNRIKKRGDKIQPCTNDPFKVIQGISKFIEGKT